MLKLRLSVKYKISLAMAACAVVLVAIGGTAFWASHRLNSQIEGIYNSNVMPLRLLSEVRKHVAGNRDAILVAEIDPKADITTLAQTFQTHDNARSKAWAGYYPERVTDPAELAKAKKYLTAQSAYEAAQDRVLAVFQSGDRAGAVALARSELRTLYPVVIGALDSLVDINVDEANRAKGAATVVYSDTRVAQAVLLVAGLVVFALIAFGLIRMIIRPLFRAAGLAQAITAGRLGNSVDVEGHDEFAQLLRSLRQMDLTLSRIVGEVRESSASVSESARQIALGNDDLSQRTQSQAASLEETASAMEEMTATVKQNSDSVSAASQLATGARTHAERGGEVVSRAISAMEDISTSSRHIADIVGLIDEIAFQTNLLALNAAVEAARAGDQGRGFAVVASEVRGLAQRSAAAAKEIKELITHSVAKVKVGGELVGESGEVLSEIVESVKKVTEIVAEIAAASQQQSTGIDEVNTSVMRMDETTQQNAALVEQAAAASRSMEEQANRLIEQVAFFRTSDTLAAGEGHETSRRRAVDASDMARTATPTAAHGERGMAHGRMLSHSHQSGHRSRDHESAGTDADAWASF
ncbi:methyl-accepting chemotaxis protein [Oleiagrimonas sp. C23AA]|uniref:methyl-accepting chemotaxis protein n=1 Tax=Oleiagrimonas sp. C23AA TaxID=2719047 RepID=UPI001423C1C8|nr:methyl-accepting chemotaxis protein [Oleiagrimonas sp. C23AA]NII09497.1 HAMP domain-containing protein [Oleiagrimonas sp. C23AA]